MEPHLNNPERRRNRLPMWSWIAGSVLLAIVLGWGFVELAGQLQGDRTLSFVSSHQSGVGSKCHGSTGSGRTKNQSIHWRTAAKCQ